MSAPQADWGWSSAYPAPAKLNLFLHVVGRRTDGYHLLQTAFRFVDYGDTLHFSPRTDGQVRLLTPLPGVPEAADLTVRAARSLQEASACHQGVDIRLEKRLPMGGGLGGGSSDAATVLLALNHLWGLGLSRSRLQELGLALGADVPIFIFGHAAFAEGVGESLGRIEVPPAWYLVLEPPVAVPTLDIFRAPELKRDTPAISAAAWRPGMGGNDLEAVACARYPAVAEHLTWLGRFGQARMSGSGACVFVEFAERIAAEAALAQLPEGFRGWVAAGLAEHPLQSLAG
ncbi:4-diphosphocytidyl-2-C-methyl-D-erythritol kinase [Azospira sp. I13]|uniref:4-(cytidine 5'-diphospho)-2-C-methyl-D-erythritol kinase n=1 Tax=Azospira sp. I13 TaxID=1765050 RepID=UPI000D45F6C1|nr:4-(cytidine 5'-diphospho)-2-C-methyl-D-erythritol kinase [Azospira sp. I13]GBG03428.1 4-diphosphocytidyl-2-C-methyl-D-erythritol kinase [Azospira sp. I13]